MRRLLYCLLGSTLFHGLLLWAPFPMSAGGAGEPAARPLRVRLVAESAAEPGRRVSERARQSRRPRKVSQAKARKSPAATGRPKTAPRDRTRTVAALPAAPRPADPAPTRTEPVAKEARKEQPRRARPEPPGASKQAVGTRSAADLRPAIAPVPARDPGGNAGGDETAARETRLARGVAPEKSATVRVEGAAGFSPVRYARTVKPRYPGKARRAGWQGTTVLKVMVGPDGAPGRVTVDRTSGFEILDAAAVKAVGGWRFHPARRGSDNVASWVRIPVAFKLKEDKR